MISAFGIDHGDYEVEKAFGGGLVRTLGQGIGQSARVGAKKVGGMAGKSIGAGRPITGKAQIGVGRGLKKISNFAMQRPGAAGGIALGGAGAAAAGGGFAAGQNQRRRF